MFHVQNRNMKNKRFRKYLQKKKVTDPIDTPGEVDQHQDAKIDQDAPGFPHGQASPGHIKPKTDQQRKTAATQVKDGEKKEGF